jgi:membrane protein implicated in regulation of membrane protease activity
MTWWIWVIAGVFCLTAELTFISADFYLLFVGLAAILTGLLTAFCPDCPVWGPWVLFILLTAMGVGFFRERLSDRFRVRGIPAPGLSAIGDTVVVARDLDAGAEDRLEFRGASWAVRNDSPVMLTAGQRATVCGIDGLTLLLAPSEHR